MNWTQAEITATYLKVQELATVDKTFKAELLKNPIQAIEKLTGKAIPEGYNINVIENDHSLTITLPQLSGELSDDDLDNVAGGINAYSDINGDCGAYACK
ncbi:MAG: NHLP leader peptide family RiPP precursor [Defluviitaleaceae bacterium]|nr:NHLP leader peptide family RiPP precursor [Defluviitaleaceae bacterium]